MQVYNHNDQEIREAVKVAAFVFIFGLFCVSSLVAFSIIRDSRTQQEAETRQKSRQIHRVSSAETRSQAHSTVTSSDD